MIGKSLRERHGLGGLQDERAVSIVTEALASQAERLVQVRSQDVRMIACLVVRADAASIRICRALGFDVRPGGTGVFGLLGVDVVRFLPDLPLRQREWLETACGPRETKVLLVCGGTALLSLATNDGKVVVAAHR